MQLFTKSETKEYCIDIMKDNGDALKWQIILSAATT